MLRRAAIRRREEDRNHTAKIYWSALCHRAAIKKKEETGQKYNVRMAAKITLSQTKY